MSCGRQTGTPHSARGHPEVMGRTEHGMCHVAGRQGHHTVLRGHPEVMGRTEHGMCHVAGRQGHHTVLGVTPRSWAGRSTGCVMWQADRDTTQC